MGVIKQILVNKEVPTPEFNERLVIEMCENVHLHYRNLRLEFSKEEFYQLVSVFQRIDRNKILRFEYGEDKFELLTAQERLPEATEHDKRLQIEEQDGGGFHVHYRNLRIEVKDLSEVGIVTPIT
jgi:hypothetical protein